MMQCKYALFGGLDLRLDFFEAGVFGLAGLLLGELRPHLALLR